MIDQYYKSTFVLMCAALLIGVVLSPAPVTSKGKQMQQAPTSRARQHFYANCMLNKLMIEEFKLGMLYLNASAYMRSDRVALHGFGNMYKRLWLEQLENMDKIRRFIIMRGGAVESPHFTSESVLSKVNHFENESSLLDHFLGIEMRVTRELLEVQHSSTTWHTFEIICQTNHANGVQYSLPPEDQVDPFTSQFLDESLSPRKLEKIKQIADLLTRIERFDNSESQTPVGVHLLDQELLDKYQ